MNPVAGSVNLVRLIQAILSVAKKDTLNKTQVHKLTYLACSTGLDCDFEFRMHHYGPYSFALEDAIHLLEGVGVLTSTVEEHDGWSEYKIQLGDRVDSFLNRFGRLVPEDEIPRRISSMFGGKSTPELELLGMVHLVHSILNREWRGSAASRQNVLDSVQGLKPRFSMVQISQAYDDLVSNELLSEGSKGS